MILDLKIKLAKYVLNYYVLKFGLDDKKTMRMSCKIDKLINEKIYGFEIKKLNEAIKEEDSYQKNSENRI